MKSKTILKLSFIGIPIKLLFVVILLISCEKEKGMPSVAKKQASSLQKTANEPLVKFLSISLDVSKDEIVFDEINNQFLIRGQKFNRVEVEANYEGANVYKTTYGE